MTAKQALVRLFLEHGVGVEIPAARKVVRDLLRAQQNYGAVAELDMDISDDDIDGLRYTASCLMIEGLIARLSASVKHWPSGTTRCTWDLRA